MITGVHGRTGAGGGGSRPACSESTWIHQSVYRNIGDEILGGCASMRGKPAA